MSGPGTLRLTRGRASKTVDPGAYLDGAAEERARADEHHWIKQVRLARVDGLPFRQRFTYREDSLWWFAELFLHKQQVVLQICRTLAALDRLIASEAPERLSLVGGDLILRRVLPLVCGARGITAETPAGARGAWSIAGMEARAVALHAAAMLSRVRPRRAPHRARVSVLAFLHRAFWREGADDGSGESYIGPVLEALERRAPAGGVHYVGVGPASNFSARRWWHPLAASGTQGATVPIEAYAPVAALRGSRELFARRHEARDALWRSADLRALARIGGVDCWPLIRGELAGIALLQWPWSARAMDEAGAALDALRPAAALTYAEAGGWGRALVLECRRRGIPSAGLQHGFIYRHWLNYRHEPDEVAADPAHPADLGFPRPTRTLLFDGFAAAQLRDAGHLPDEALEVTGSPRLDALAAGVRALAPPAIADAKAGAGADPGDALVLVVAKHREARAALPALLDAAARLPHTHVAIKTHPAETPEVYATLVSGRRVSVLPAGAPLAPLLAAARVVVTVNSTVALDAAVLGIPALVIGLPNNLSPFVEAGALAGSDPARLPHDLEQILYDEEFRRRLAAARREVLARFGMASEGEASERTAAAVLRLAAGGG